MPLKIINKKILYVCPSACDLSVFLCVINILYMCLPVCLGCYQLSIIYLCLYVYLKVYENCRAKQDPGGKVQKRRNHRISVLIWRSFIVGARAGILGSLP